MRIATVQVKNIKSVEDSGALHLGPRVNVLIGQNNAGKSVLIRAIHLMQSGSLTPPNDVRVAQDIGEVDVGVTDAQKEMQLLGLPPHTDEATLQFRLSRSNNSTTRTIAYATSNSANVGTFPQTEPHNVIYPFLAKRKVMVYDEVVNQSKTTQVLDNFTHLVSKVDRLTTPSHQLFQEFRDNCRRIIGFEIDSVPSPGGHKIGFPVGATGSITLETMGEGVPHLLALIADLCIADGKIFLIEEVENDLHPRALKNLLELIVEKSARNQFIVTTHSNIVARYLGSVEGSKTFRVQLEFHGQIPTATYREVPEDPEERRRVLEELGYEMTDYDLWDGWLVLEESSAERIIKDLLIPQFAPGLLGRVRTIAAGGVDGVALKFDDFNRLFLFTHLTPSYRNRAWVIVDGGERGNEVVKGLRAKYSASGWTQEHFRALTESDFELYYPPQFQEAAAAALVIGDGRAKQAAKAELLETVLSWMRANPAEATEQFAQSATEVIVILQEIEKALAPPAASVSTGQVAEQ